jgi:hypothetical protein
MKEEKKNTHRTINPNKSNSIIPSFHADSRAVILGSQGKASRVGGVRTVLGQMQV